MNACEHPDAAGEPCGQPGPFFVYAAGYPMPMHRHVCAEHLGPTLEDDQATPGATSEYRVVVVR